VEDLLCSHFLHYIRDRFPNTSDTLQRRLSRTMLLRRRRILYGRHYQKKTAVQPQITTSEPIIESSIAALTESAGAPTNLPEDKHSSPIVQDTAALSSSVVSASRTISLRRHEALRFPPAPGSVVKRRDERLRRQRSAAKPAYLSGSSNSYNHIDSETGTSLPEPEKTSKIEIMCPYCLEALPAEVAFVDHKWR